MPAVRGAIDRDDTNRADLCVENASVDALVHVALVARVKDGNLAICVWVDNFRREPLLARALEAVVPAWADDYRTTLLHTY